MITSFILVSVFAGLLAFGVALLFGASFWLGFGVYTLVGSTSLILLSIAKMAAGIRTDHTVSSTATDRLKKMENHQTAESSANQQNAVIQPSMRILAVDDDPFILELIPMISTKAGFTEVTSAASGEQALKLLDSSDTIFDCLLLDISMPDMNGIELCRCIRQINRYRHTPIIMLTAMRDMASMGDAYRAGATEYATKPFDIEKLTSRLRLVQEAIHTQQDKGPALHEGRGSNRAAVLN